MEVNRLLGDEIAHELTIRCLPVRNTVAENRATLRGALRMEREGLSSIIEPNIGLLPQDELRTCSEKLNDLGNSIQHFDHANKENECKRISSRLLHIQNRLKRISITNPEMTRVRSNLLGQCFQLVEALGVIKDSGKEDFLDILEQENRFECSILDEDNLLLPELVSEQVMRSQRDEKYPSPMNKATSDAFEEMHNTDNQIGWNNVEYENLLGDSSSLIKDGNGIRPDLSTNVRTEGKPERSVLRPMSFDLTRATAEYETKRSTYPISNHLEETLEGIRTQLQNLQQASYSGYHHPDIRSPSSHAEVARWKIQFDGDSSVTNFLERIEELRVSRGISKEQLLRSGPELFTKDALNWFRTKDFKSWDELTEQLKNDFQPYDYEFDLMEEIRKRTQGSKERVVSFVSAMENLFKKLGINKPQESARVKMIRRNLLPYLQNQLALHQISTIAELTRLCKAVEETEVRTQKFQPPPTNYRQLLEPELAYKKPVSHAGNHLVAPIKATEVSTEVVAEESAAICWNCGKRGHRFKKCQEPRKIFCYKCGLEKVFVKNCPNCAKNLKGGLKRTG